MSDQGSLRLLALFETALEDYKQQTGIELAEHPLAEHLQDGNSVESVTAILCEQAQDFKEFREKDKVLKPLKKVLTVLSILPSVADFAQDVGFHLPPVKAIQTGLGILLSAVKGASDDYSALADLLESIGHFLNRLEIYTEIPPTEAMNEMIVKILVELLSTLALTTKEIQQGKLIKLVGKLAGEKKMEAMVQRLDRLTRDEARQTVAQIFKVVHGLIENMKVVMNDGEVSVDHLKETLEMMHQVASDLNKAKRDSLQKDIFGWLSPPDPWKNHHAACKSRHPGTAEWFIHGNTFPEWRTSEVPGSLLWVHGKPGAGKSVFCASIIEDIHAMRKAGLASLAFFYCDFREDRKMELRGLLSSFLVQLYHQSDSYFDILSKFYLEHDKGSRPPSDDALAGCLKDLLKLPGLAPIYLVVDALDECPKPSVVRSPRADVLSLIEELVKAQIRNLLVCVTSRPELDIKDVLDPLIFCSVSLHDESGQKKDIEDYIKSVINTRTIKGRWKEGHRKLVIDVLTEKSNGMFRWVDCQVVHICNCTPAGIRQALVELPETLDETYERTLRWINKANWKTAHRMFQFVSVASRPLRVKELADLLAFDFEAGSIPKFYEDWRLENPVDAVLSTCSTLLAIDNDEGSPVIQFSHFSVKEFLTSTRLAEAPDNISQRYHVSMTPAHTLVAQACLGILLHLDKDVTKDSLEDFPLAEYAAEHWLDHVRFEDVSGNVEDGMKQLFDPSKQHLAICVWIYDPISKWKPMMQINTPQPLPGTSLHYAASWGLHSVIEFLIIVRLQDVCSRDSTNNGTPLHFASHNGHAKASCKLIECGADVTARDSYGSTPIHLASRMGRVDVARMLIERGADVTAQDNEGWTPLHLTLHIDESLDHAINYIRCVDTRFINDPDTFKQFSEILTSHRSIANSQAEVFAKIEELFKDAPDLYFGFRDFFPNADSAQAPALRIYGSSQLHPASQRGQVEVARMLIERGADVTAQNNDGWTPLHLALEDGEAEVARMLIERGADLAAHSIHGVTPLHMASQRALADLARLLIECGRAGVTAQNNDGWSPLQKEVKVARMLIERGADLAAQDIDGWTPLHVASKGGEVDVARMLIERGADLAAQDNDGLTPLHLASEIGGVDVVRMLTERGANLTAQDNNGCTPLHLASCLRQVDVACMLIERGASLTARDNYENIPLHLAVGGGKVDVARMLIERGADLAARNEDEDTPLHVAVAMGKVDVTYMLIERGADLTAKNNYGSTPLYLALDQKKLDVAHILIEHDADMTAQNKYGGTPLHLALQKGQIDIARMLIERGADLTAQNRNAWTPLHLASQRGQVDIARMLIEHGADVTAQNRDGQTPLHLASAPSSRARISPQNYAEVVRMLLEHGADINSRNKNGITPFVLASKRGLAEVIHVLVQHGADSGAHDNVI